MLRWRTQHARTNNRNIDIRLDCFKIRSAWNKGNLGNLENIALTVKSDITRFKHFEILHSVKKVIHGANKIVLPNIFGRFYMGPLVSEKSEFHIKTYSYLPPLPSNLQFVGRHYDL